MLSKFLYIDIDHYVDIRISITVLVSFECWKVYICEDNRKDLSIALKLLFISTSFSLALNCSWPRSLISTTFVRLPLLYSHHLLLHIFYFTLVIATERLPLGFSQMVVLRSFSFIHLPILNDLS